MAEEKILWFAAVDWGSEKHQACVLDAQGGVAGEREFSHSGAGLAELCDWIVSIAGEVSTVAVALEVPHGPVVDTLLDRGFTVYSINPKQLDRLRDRFGVAGAKDDRRDARVSTDGLRTDRHLFRRRRSLTPALSRYVTGRVWPKSCSRSGYVWAIASVTSSGAITRRCSNSPTTLPPTGFWSSGPWCQLPLRRHASVRRPSRSCSNASASVVSM